MSEPVKQIFRFILFILVQGVILNHMPPLYQFSQYITPYLYFLFILWMPFRTTRSSLLFAGFFTGLALDFFTKTPGLHAAVCVLIAYIRPFLIELLVPRETKELSLGSPSRTTMGTAPYIVYVVVLTLFHNAYLVFLEWMQFGSFSYFALKVLCTTLVSLLLIFITELLFSKRGRRQLASSRWQ
jgi:rod shape-determining protein MreD